MKRLVPILPWLGGLLLIAVALLCFETHLLWKVQQYNTFLDTPLFFSDQMLTSGGFLSYVSGYFTQFFFHPWLGILMLCCWWLLLMWLTKRAFCISDSWAVLALIPVAILLIMDMSLGYWHYFMKLRGYFYVPTIGTTVAVALLWAFRALPQKLWLRCLFVFVVTFVGYVLFGIYGLAAVLLMGIWTWRLSKIPSQNAILTIVALLSIIVVPLFCYRYIYYQTYFDDIWTTSLPSYVAVESFPLYYIPYYLLAGFFLLMVLFYQKSLSLKALTQKPYLRWSPQILLVLVLLVSVWHFWFKDENFHHELAMQHCVENTDWEGVLAEGEKQVDEPTHPISMMYNLALMKLGRQLDELYTFPRGTKKCNTPLPVNIFYHVYGRMYYYNYGLLNDCHRICMEDGVEYGWRVELLQYLARSSMLNGEKSAAKKALNLLRHTQYFGKWADNVQELIDNPKLIAEARETGPITHMLHYKNAIGFDGGNIEKYAMGMLSRQDSKDIYFQEQAVLAALWLGNPKKFWGRFGHYAGLQHHGIPILFQEGAYLFVKQGARPELDKFPFDKGVIKTYNAFIKDAQKYNGQSPEIGRAALSPFYGNTYFFDYYFYKNLKK